MKRRGPRSSQWPQESPMLTNNKKDPRHFFAFTNKASVLTLDVMDVIGQDFFGDGITAANFTSAMKDAGEFGSITLNVNSPGGSLFEGVAIYNVLKSCGKPVNVN